MKLRVRAKDLKVNILLNTITLPDVPDWVFEISDELPSEFTGMALVNVGTT